MLGHSGGQIVIPELAGNAVQHLKSVNVTTNKGLETLAVRELQILHPAVSIDEGEGVELPLVALVVERPPSEKPRRILSSCWLNVRNIVRTGIDSAWIAANASKPSRSTSTTATGAFR